MSTQSAGPPNTALTSGTPDPELDITKLHTLPSEQQELYLLNFVSELWRHVESLSDDALGAHTPAIKREVIKTVGLSAPSPSRIIRHNLGKLLGSTFARGSRALLFESVNDLLAIINTGKGEKDLGTKHTATVVIGYLYAAAGDGAVSSSGLVCQSLLKLLKIAQPHAGLRGSVYRALGFIVQGLGSSIDEHVARDIWKQARSSATSDKAAVVQKRACLCLKSLLEHTPFFNNASDFDSLRSTLFRVVDNILPAVRHAAAAVLAQALFNAYADVDNADVVPIVKKPKKSKKQTTPSDDAEQDRPGSPAPSKPTIRLRLNLRECLRILSVHYTKASTSNRSRAGLVHCYKILLQQLPVGLADLHYGTIADHFFSDILNHPTTTNNRYRHLLTRRYVRIVLGDMVGSRLLSESGQISAAKWLINDILKAYPRVLQEQREPAKRVLVAALECLAGLISCLGAASSIFQEQCREALLQVLRHPNYTVRVHATHCVRVLVAVCPTQCLLVIEPCLHQLRRDIDDDHDQRHSHARLVGHANALSAAASTLSQNHIYSSVEILSRAFMFATELLKASSSSELRLSATQVQVAWTIIGGLMTLGPSFVKVHLNQIVLLWRNALPVPLTTDNAAKRGHLELSFLTHVRECALGALLLFLEFNSALLTTDATKRVSQMLHNSVLFLESLPHNRQSEDLSNRLVKALQLHDLSIMMQRRLLQCFSALLKVKHLDHRETLAQSDVLNLAVRAFTSPENPFPKSLEASIASAAGNFERVWDHGDNWSFGVNSLMTSSDAVLHDFHAQIPTIAEIWSRTSEENEDMELMSPAGRAVEHDSNSLYRSTGFVGHGEPIAATSVINNGIGLFAITLPLQSPKVQESAVEQLVTWLAQPFQREPGKKAAVQINIVAALLCSLLVANGETVYLPGKLATSSMETAFSEILHGAVGDDDPVLRKMAALAIGRLCNLCGSQFTNNEVKHLIDTIVANRAPNVRAGCALALGYIHSLVGGMAASYHLKNMVGVLLSLCGDAHPLVHFSALTGLREVSDSAGLTFSSFAANTLGLLAQLYSSDNHNEEAALTTTSNLELEFSTPPVVGQCVDAIINVLGPDLQDVSKARQLILTLVDYFRHDEITALQARALSCLGHLSLYAPAHLPLSKFVLGLQRGLKSQDGGMQSVAIDGLGSLMRRNASEVVRVASSSLTEDLWLTLDDLPGNSELQTALRSWLSQTCSSETAEWVQRCQLILSKTRKKSDGDVPTTTMTATAKSSAMPDLADEEVAGFAAAAAAAQGESAETAVQSQEYLRWQTREFAMCLLSELITFVAAATLPERVTPAEASLQNKVADIVRMAFSASTANVNRLRTRGLKILNQVLELFGRTPDPDFLEASLLEQYQAQIASALTPAFAADSSPEVAAEAIQVCATFVATGIVTTVERMGRIFKVLVQGLDNLASTAPEAALGDLRGVSGNAQSLLKMAILSAWAQLILASNDQPYLEEIVKPYVSRLAPLWLTALQEFAQLRFEPEISSSLGGDGTTDKAEERYAAFVRDSRLKYYQQNWLSIVDAVAVLVDKDSESIFEALDRQTTSRQVNGVNGDGKDMSFREEPVAFFFILFGLAFEALVMQSREDPTQARAILQALKKILTPAVCGTAIYEDTVFNETTDTLDRLALTSGHDTQSVLVEISRNLALNHISANTDTDRNEKLSDDIDQLFELTRIIVLVLTGLVPTLEDPPSPATRPLSEDRAGLIQRSFQALVDVANVFPSVIRTDLHACIMHCFCTILATGVCQAEVIPGIVPMFRSFVQDVAKPARGSSGSGRLICGCLHRLLSIQAYAQRRENEYALSCAKNTLLSMTVLLTSAGVAVPPTDPLLAQVAVEFLDCLRDVGLARVAANCVRTLLLARPKSPCEKALNRQLWPSLLLFLADSDHDDPEQVRSQIAAALVASVQTLDRPGRAAALTLTVPVLLTLAVQRSSVGNSEKNKKETAQQLLSLAGMDGIAFRTVVTRLVEEQRICLQEILKTAGVGKSESDSSAEDEAERRPAIELRMDF